jgi:hypothetical protein
MECCKSIVYALKDRLHGMQGVKKNVVYLGRPIAPSDMSPNTGGGDEVAGSQPMSTTVPMEPK